MANPTLADLPRAVQTERTIRWGSRSPHRRRESVIAKADAVRLGVPKAAYVAYCAQERRARHRGIAWEFTLPEWWAWWQVDGRWSRRGKFGGCLVMARFGDTGPYNPANVYCTTVEGNSMDMSIEKRRLTPPPSSHRIGCGYFPAACPVSTPTGVFPSMTAAAVAHGISTSSVARRLAKPGSGWLELRTSAPIVASAAKARVTSRPTQSEMTFA